MPHYPDMPAVLRRQGLRVTPQRLLIVDILQHSTRHLSADDVYAQLQERFPSTDISTVYRTLEVLTGLGMIQKMTLGESHDHYEWVDEPHYHIVCQRCGTVQHFGEEVLLQLRTVLEEQHQFSIDRAYVEVFGVCARCKGQGDASPAREGSPSHEH